ncbi:MAG: hypothetical protein H6605_09950 [Flavobacteriales bacterium]|nr:hypothetical protein [Flavobacteriales bacterium]
MKHFILFISLITGSILTFAQVAYLAEVNSLAPIESFKPSEPCKIVVNLNLSKNEYGIIEIAKTEDMYLWTWSPFEHPSTSPKANGIKDPAWKNSNPLLKMTKEAEGIFSYVLTPTLFYEVNSQKVYDADFKFLVKPLDGGGYGGPDFKTEDFTIEVDPPVTVVKLSSFPQGLGAKKDTMYLSDNEPFSVIYDHKVETKTTLDSAKEFYMFIKCTGTDDIEYKLAGNAKQVSGFPELKMSRSEEDVFTGTVIPRRLLKLPAGVKVKEMSFQIVRPNLVNSDDSVDETLVFFYRSGNCE